MTRVEASRIVRDYILNDYMLNVSGGGAKQPTETRTNGYLQAKEVLGNTLYREISNEVTKRFKRTYDL